MKILLVEDNEGDILLTTEALEDAKLTTSISVVRDGEEAIGCLKNSASLPTLDLPDLILLDINLPKLNGHDVLRYIKGNDVLKDITVIMLTTSSSPRDISLSQENFASGYMTKPLEPPVLIDILAKLGIELN